MRVEHCLLDHLCANPVTPLQAAGHQARRADVHRESSCKSACIPLLSKDRGDVLVEQRIRPAIVLEMPCKIIVDDGRFLPGNRRPAPLKN